VARWIPAAAARLAVAGVTLGVLTLLLTACGADTTRHTSSSATTFTIAHAPASGPHAFADYDSDEYEPVKGHGDSDNDDERRAKDRDNDADNKTGSYFDVDDSISLGFGKSASAADRRAVSEAIARYYALAAAHDGVKACGLLAAPIAQSLPQTVGGFGGPTYYKGKTCGEVLTKIFEANVHQLATYATSMRVVKVGVENNEAVAVFAVKDHPGRAIRLRHEHGAWKVDGPVDYELI
jgi:hypothetical protein